MTGSKKQTIAGKVVYGKPIEQVVEPYPLGNRKSLSEKFPKIAAQWCHERNCGFRPDDFSSGSSVNCWWRCNKGPDHIWRQMIAVRTSLDAGCPACASRKVCLANSLAELFPEIAREWHPTRNKIKATEVTARSGQKAFWQCRKRKDHVWRAAILDRTGPDRTGCPHCRADRKQGLRHYPGLLKYFDYKKNKGIDPLKLPVNSKIWLRCPKAKDHVWYAGFWKEVAREHCPFCRGWRASSTNNLTLNKGLMQEFDRAKNKVIDPSTIILQSKIKLWWRCKKCQYSWHTAVYNRTKRNSGCPRCAQRK